MGPNGDGFAPLGRGSWEVPSVSEPPVEALYVGKNTLPVRFLHPDHVVNLKQRANVGIFPNNK